MADLTAPQHREQSLALLARGQALPTASEQRHGLLLEALTHATLALSAPHEPFRFDVSPGQLVAVPTKEPTPEPTPEPTDASAKEPTPQPARKATPRRRTTTPKDTAA